MARRIDQLGHERGDDGSASIEELAKLTAEQRTHARRVVDRCSVGMIGGQPATDGGSHGVLERRHLDAVPGPRRDARCAEAQRKQKGRKRRDLDERTLVVVSVREGDEVERLHQNGVDAARRYIGDHCGGVCADIGVRRAELGRIEIAERVALRIRLDLAPAIDMQQHDPGVCIHVAPPRNLRELGHEITFADHRAHDGLKLERTEPRGARLEEDRPGLLEIDDAVRVVGKHVPCVVVRGGEGNAVGPRAVLDIFRNCLEPFVEQVSRKRKE